MHIRNILELSHAERGLVKSLFPPPITVQQQNEKNWYILIMDNGGAIPCQGLFLNDVDKLESTADGGIRVGPFGTLEMSNFEDIVILQAA